MNEDTLKNISEKILDSEDAVSLINGKNRESTNLCLRNFVKQSLEGIKHTITEHVNNESCSNLQYYVIYQGFSPQCIHTVDVEYANSVEDIISRHNMCGEEVLSISKKGPEIDISMFKQEDHLNTPFKTKTLTSSKENVKVENKTKETKEKSQSRTKKTKKCTKPIKSESNDLINDWARRVNYKK